MVVTKSHCGGLMWIFSFAHANFLEITHVTSINDEMCNVAEAYAI